MPATSINANTFVSDSFFTDATLVGQALLKEFLSVLPALMRGIVPERFGWARVPRGRTSPLPKRMGS
jgi:hypothetical protein